MSYRNDEANTRKQIAKFTLDEWLEFRNRLEDLYTNEEISERDYKILYEIVVERRSTAELAYLGRTNQNFAWLRSNQGKPMSTRRIQQILTEHFPEFHIQTTHKRQRKDQKIRTEQNNIKKVMITEDSFCAKCGCKENLELHHMFPVALGGDNNNLNLITLCNKCHQQISIYNRSIIRRNKNTIQAQP